MLPSPVSGGNIFCIEWTFAEYFWLDALVNNSIVEYCVLFVFVHNFISFNVHLWADDAEFDYTMPVLSDAKYITSS